VAAFEVALEASGVVLEASGVPFETASEAGEMDMTVAVVAVEPCSSYSPGTRYLLASLSF
jgi:hypothetical protein